MFTIVCRQRTLVIGLILCLLVIICWCVYVRTKLAFGNIKSTSERKPQCRYIYFPFSPLSSPRNKNRHFCYLLLILFSSCFYQNHVVDVFVFNVVSILSVMQFLGCVCVFSFFSFVKWLFFPCLCVHLLGVFWVDRKLFAWQCSVLYIQTHTFLRCLHFYWFEWFPYYRINCMLNNSKMKNCHIN